MALTPDEKSDAWTQLFKIVISILTLGLSHVISKYRNKDKK